MPVEESIARPPERLSIVNLVSNEEVVVQHNPNELEEEYSADYDRLSTQGQSHQRMHYRNTNNFVTQFDLLCRAYTLAEYEEIRRAKAQLASWVYPRKITRMVAGGGGPPNLLITWPEMFSFEGLLIRCRFRSLAFRPTGGATRWIASLQFEEQRDSRLTFDQVALATVVRGEL